MAKSILSTIALMMLVSIAQAGPASETRHDAIVVNHHDYWLSEGLSRLAFWQQPQNRRDETRHQ